MMEVLNEAGKAVPWWQAVPKDVEAIARKMCSGYLNPDTPVLPYPATFHRTPSTDATLVHMADVVPLWTCYVAIVREAMAAVKAGGGEEAVAPAVAPAKTPDQLWRDDTGLSNDTDQS
jgi:hypothetical protein